MNGTQTIKEGIKDHFIEILKTTSFNKVNVTMIAEKAGISKQTFYRYFLDKHDLAKSISFEMLSAFALIYGNNCTWKEVALSILHSISNHQVFFKRMLKDPDGEQLVLGTLIDISKHFTGAPVSRYALEVWRVTLEDWCNAGFATTIEEVYLHIIRNLPTCEVVPDIPERHEYFKDYETTRLTLFSKRWGS